MRSLPELQQAFAGALIDATRAPALSPMLRGAGPIERLGIYRGNLYGNATKALGGAYPVVRAIVGEEFFEGLAREYARAQPSRSGDLNACGDRLAEFVSEFPHTRDLPYLPDVARLEWLAHLAYYAADAPAFDPARLAAVPAERQAMLRPRLAPACALMESRWPLARIWEVHQPGFAGSIEVNLDSGPDRVLVHRPQWRAEVATLARGEFRFLAAARDGASLGEALRAAANADPAFDAGNALAPWVSLGAIVALD
ncbi:MAG TPA: DNA-binding domain-containing protein [Burkholderiales bacterium]|nr:DNA-binding domain-containing protein [Burkholderiales bacterium]